MATTARSDSYLWVTWLTKLLAGDDQCEWAAWFKAHFKNYDKVERGGFDSAAWKAAHNDMLRKRVGALTADGWTVTLEDQNAFNLKGDVATLSGKPDIVAVRGREARVVDCKTGQHREGDFQQVLIYLLVLPMLREDLKNLRLVGELQYKDASFEIAPEQLTPDVCDRIVAAIKTAGGSTPPGRVPSYRECAWCDIPKANCPDRIEKKKDAASAGGLF